METSLHRQLKSLYSAEPSAQEVRLDTFRIDAVHEGLLIEIQQGSLGAIRPKIRRLLEQHDVLVVKPLVARKILIRRKRAGGKVVSTRQSPKRETIADLFADLVYFVDVFPNPRLTLEVVFTHQEEHRVTSRKKWWRGPDFRVTDRLLVGIEGRVTLRDTADLLRLLPEGLGEQFTTEEIARLTPMPRWLAQKMAYCLRKMGAVEALGKRGNSWLYRVVPPIRSITPAARVRRPRRAAS
ncbi:MAG TPA: hypothetical protein VFG04_02080 [Planctomycetaceae bacterium]|jgi:hypothetical protein|nr:hypothetical protein [Planctomycetaceae bacterium]